MPEPDPDAGPADDEFPTGTLLSVLPVGADGLDVAGDVAGEVAFAVADEEALFVADAVAEAEALAWAAVGDVEERVVLAQLGSALGATLLLLAGSELGLELEPLGLGGDVDVDVSVPLVLGLGLTLELGLVLALAEELAAAEVAVPALLWLPLGDAAGALVVAVVLAGELESAEVTAECAEGDEQGLAVGRAVTSGEGGTEPALAEGVEMVPWPSVAPAPPEGLLLVKAWLMALPSDSTAWRPAGTTDRITPTANTAAPRAKAGRSIASRQSLGRCGSRRRGAGRCDAGRLSRSRPGRRNNPVAKPEIASQTPSAPLGLRA